MKIARIETIPLEIPHEHGGPPPARGGLAWQGVGILLLVRVDPEDEASGWGEPFRCNCMPAGRAIEKSPHFTVIVGGRFMMQSGAYVGPGVHKNTITGAVTLPGRGEPGHRGEDPKRSVAKPSALWATPAQD